MYLSRFALVFAIALFALSAFLLLALLPSYLALSFAAAPSLSNGTEHGTPGDPQAVARTQALVAQLLPVLSSTSSPSIVIKTAILDMPTGVAFQHVSYVGKQGVTGGTVMIVGEATREKVAAYRDALSKDPLFRGVSVPVSALVGSDAGHFSITLTGNF